MTSCGFDVANEWETSRCCGRIATWEVIGSWSRVNPVHRCDEHAGQGLNRENVVRIVPFEVEARSRKETVR